MRKLLFMLFATLFVACGKQECNEWSNCVTGNGDIAFFNVGKVWFHADRTELLLHIDYYYDLMLGRDIRLQADGKEYALIDSVAPIGYGFPESTVVEYDKTFSMPKSGKADVLLTFEPLPADTKMFNLIAGDAWALNRVRNGDALPSTLVDTYWRSKATGEWLIGFAQNHVVWDCAVWDIVAMEERDGEYALNVKRGDKSMAIEVGKMRGDTRKIAVDGGKAVKCTPIGGASLCDYPVKDKRVGIKDNGYSMGDSVTIVGWLKDMPDEVRNNCGNEFCATFENLFVHESDYLFSATMDSLGRFTLSFPLMNSTQVLLDWRRNYVSTVLSPGERYFFIYDFKTGNRLWMGDDVRLQNELLALPHGWMNCRMDTKNSTAEQAMDFLRTTAEKRNMLIAELAERVEQHPRLSTRYIDYLTGYYTTGIGESLMQAQYRMAGDTFPDEYMAYADSIWNCTVQLTPYTIYRDFNRFLFDYMYYKKSHDPVSSKTAPTLLRLASDGRITLTDRELEIVKGYDAAVQRLQEYVATHTEKENEAAVAEFNAGEYASTVTDIYYRNLNVIQQEGVCGNAWRAIGRVQSSPALTDIYMASVICGEINTRRSPLPENIIEWADSHLQLPAARTATAQMQEKYLALSGKVANGNSIKSADRVKGMSNGEKILRKLTEPCRGRYVLVDVWGTWCGPCKAALAKSKEEFERLAPYNMVFLYLANRSEDDSWKNVIKEYNVVGDNVLHYNLPPEQQSAVENYLGVSSYPCYRLISPVGDLLDVNADPRNLDAFEQMMKSIIK